MDRSLSRQVYFKNSSESRFRPRFRPLGLEMTQMSGLFLIQVSSVDASYESSLPVSVISNWAGDSSLPHHRIWLSASDNLKESDIILAARGQMYSARDLRLLGYSIYSVNWVHGQEKRAPLIRAHFNARIVGGKKTNYIFHQWTFTRV